MLITTVKKLYDPQQNKNRRTGRPWECLSFFTASVWSIGPLYQMNCQTETHGELVDTDIPVTAERGYTSPFPASWFGWITLREKITLRQLWGCDQTKKNLPC